MVPSLRFFLFLFSFLALEPAEKAEPVGRALEPAGRALDPVRRVSKEAKRASEEAAVL